jgi:hypothetical protein
LIEHILFPCRNDEEWLQDVLVLQNRGPLFSFSVLTFPIFKPLVLIENWGVTYPSCNKCTLNSKDLCLTMKSCSCFHKKKPSLLLVFKPWCFKTMSFKN